MSKYNDEYVFILKNEDDLRLPSLKADITTSQRQYDVEPVPTDSSPYVFFNGWREENIRDGSKDHVANILFEGANFMVRDHIRELLLQRELPGLTMHPSIYLDDAGNRHEGFWFLTFKSELDCWDRDRSTFMPGTSTRDMVFNYSLSAEVLNAIPLQQRLLFQMGGTLESPVLCHRSLAAIFRQNGDSGAMLKAVRDYP
ncbi:hypothetical protein [Pseudoduganella umbonata]|uniref:Uncharacterized protein n=1 Tax=Pseudoduganella umbonata TaxID=864828 RepID=A0A4P8HYT4_9BURK|nr:hypothetical protein [Pseudoduganella umbonata]MBB3222023.1 hypothetical protein [Pseudoduganella umbonata]QCP14192.1 hypothetical protein FCL38_30080 [Pseudoduganella umbonata]